MLSSSRVEVDAETFLGLGRDAALRASVLSTLRQDLLAPASASARGLALVVTDWHGLMPDDVRALLGVFVRAQSRDELGTSLRLTSGANTVEPALAAAVSHGARSHT